MHSQDHRHNNISSGHENHICHRCGWPFPNPHPSAKHRRAHKKICGSIEGYKLIESNADDDHSDDDDGPKMEEKRVAEKSIKSEDEVFSDAAMEFSDSGVSSGNEDVEKLAKFELKATQLLKVDTTADMSGSSNDTKSSSQISSSEVINTAKDEPEAAKSLNDVEVEKSSVESSQIIASELNSFVRCEAAADALLKETHEDDNKEEPSMTENEDDVLDKALDNSNDPHVKAVRESSEHESITEEAGKQTSDSLVLESVIPEIDRGRDSESETSKEKSSSCVSLENVVHELVISETKQMPESQTQEGVIPEASQERDSELEASKQKSSDFDEPVILETKQMPESQVQEQVIPEANRDRDFEMVASTGKSSMRVTMENATDEPVILEGKQISESQTQESVIPETDQERNFESESLKEESSVHVTQENVGNEPVTTKYNLQVRDGQTSGPDSKDVMIDQKEDENDEAEVIVYKCGPSPLVKPLTHVEDSVSDFAHARDGSDQSKTAGVYDGRDEGNKDSLSSNLNKDREETSVPDLKEPREEDAMVCNLGEAPKDNVVLFSVPKSSVVTENIENMSKGFKDYNTLKNSFPLDVGTAEIIRSVESDDKATSAKAVHSGFRSGDPSGTLDSSSADSNALKHNIRGKSVEKPTEGGVDISGVTEEHSVGPGLQVLSDAPMTKAQNIQPGNISEKMQLSSIDVELLEKTNPENAPRDDDDDDTEINGSDRMVAARKESSKELLENELPANKKTVQEDADSYFISEDNQTNGSPGVDKNQHHERARDELLDTEPVESTNMSCEKILLTDKEAAAHGFSGQTEKSTSVNMVPDEARNPEKMYLSVGRCTEESSEEATQGYGSGGITEVAESAGSASKDIQANHEGYISKEMLPCNVGYEILNRSSSNVETSYTTEAVQNPSDSGPEPSRDEVDNKLEKQHEGVSAVDISVASSGRADSLEANWGSVSVVSTQSDTTTADTGILPPADSRPPKTSDAEMETPKRATDEIEPEKSDVFDAPSFMTLVESGNHRPPKDSSSETQTENNTEQPKHDYLRAGWFPSLSNVVNEPQGRKKNEEIIAKVSNWSTGKQHSPLKHLLVEAKSPKPEQVTTVTQSDETAAKSDGDAASFANPVLHSNGPHNRTDNKEMEKEWNSPARFPSEMKKAKKKGKPYWVPFVCCSSVHRDL